VDRLILLRHGKAEADAPSGQDFDRGLTDRGRRDAALVARTLAEAGLVPDLVLVSPAARALQTWEAAAPSFPDAKVEPALALYNISPDEILLLAKNDGEQARTVMVVGHNPGLGQLATLLSRQMQMSPETRAALAHGFPTGAAAAIDFGSMALVMVTPRALGGGS
jgi:phosphohistidine phosphatase